MLTKARRHVDLKTLVRFVKQIKYRLVVCVYFVIKNKCTVNLPFGQSASCFSLCILTIDNSVNPQFGLSVSYGQNDFNIFYKGIDLFSAYTDTDIQNKLNADEFSMTLNDSSIISKNLGYDVNDVTGRSPTCLFTEEPVK